MILEVIMLKLEIIILTVPLINQAEGLYGRILTKVVSTDRTQ